MSKPPFTAAALRGAALALADLSGEARAQLPEAAYS